MLMATSPMSIGTSARLLSTRYFSALSGMVSTVRSLSITP